MRFFVLIALGSLVFGCGGGTGGLPMPLMLTLSALWGTFENAENIQMSGNVVGQNATYICDRPGAVEICVDATDGACVKTLCTTVTCPNP
jgi:hypothetical protein